MTTFIERTLLRHFDPEVAKEVFKEQFETAYGNDGEFDFAELTKLESTFKVVAQDKTGQALSGLVTYARGHFGKLTDFDIYFADATLNQNTKQIATDLNSKPAQAFFHTCVKKIRSSEALSENEINFFLAALKDTDISQGFTILDLLGELNAHNKSAQAVFAKWDLPCLGTTLPLDSATAKLQKDLLDQCQGLDGLLRRLEPFLSDEDKVRWIRTLYCQLALDPEAYQLTDAEVCQSLQQLLKSLPTDNSVTHGVLNSLLKQSVHSWSNETQQHAYVVLANRIAQETEFDWLEIPREAIATLEDIVLPQLSAEFSDEMEIFLRKLFGTEPTQRNQFWEKNLQTTIDRYKDLQKFIAILLQKVPVSYLFPETNTSAVLTLPDTNFFTQAIHLFWNATTEVHYANGQPTNVVVRLQARQHLCFPLSDSLRLDQILASTKIISEAISTNEDEKGTMFDGVDRIGIFPTDPLENSTVTFYTITGDRDQPYIALDGGRDILKTKSQKPDANQTATDTTSKREFNLVNAP